ncbi:hypothetical protein KP509_1Z204600 [Ceratopteris richardii]|nr:hypothetical protein KP509_1Z204600 [Ceratopteris richardii]
MRTAFTTTDLGPLTYVLGMHVIRDRPRGMLYLHQSKFASDLLSTYGFDTVKPVRTPLALKTKHSIYDSPSHTPTSDDSSLRVLSLVRPLIGKFRYLVSCSRFDLCFAINYLSRFMHNPSLSHWYSLKRCIRYLKHTKHHGIRFTRSFSHDPPLELLGWSDSDWGGEIDTRKSTASGVFMLAGGAVAWFSKKQTSVALSSAEAEFVALALTAKEGVWLQTLLKELLPSQPISLKIMCDNQSCIQLASNPKHSEKTKHVDLKYHYIRELVEQKKLQLTYVSTHLMWADLLTKPLAADKFTQCSKHLGLCDTAQL